MDYKTFSNYQFQHLGLIQPAFQEDLPKGDLTTDSLGLNEKIGKAKLVAKEDLVVSGLNLFIESFLYIDPNLSFRVHFEDGDKVFSGQTVCEIKGNLLSCLKAERTALNFLGMFSGIASYTRCFVDRIHGTNTKILDTRKTTPLYRKLCKQAVLDGGGTNHRINLSDAVLIKENHIRAHGGKLKQTVTQIKSVYDGPIEVETTNLDEVKEAVEAGANRIMLDNMDNETTAKALTMIPEGIQTEASGNMNIDRVLSVAKLGVDFISVGAITHSAPVADFSLLFLWNEEE